MYALIIALFVLIVDAATKYWVVSHIPRAPFGPMEYPYGGIAVFKNFLGIEFSINYVSNHGAAWGVFADHSTLLLWARVVLVIGLIFYILYWNTKRQWRIPLTLITVGAIGNIIDIFVYGHVVDMFHFVFWGFDYPVFNSADAAIFCGVVWLFLDSWEKKSYGST